MPQIDWHTLFVPTINPFELVFRGTVIYFAVLIALRVFRREAGGLNKADLLVVILVADAAQNGMASRYESLTEGLILVLTIVGWSYLIDWASYRFSAIERLLNSPPLALIADGRLQLRNLRAEMISLAELKSHLREHGVEEIGQVKRCYLEPDGQLSVVRRDGEEAGPSGKRPAATT